MVAVDRRLSEAKVWLEGELGYELESCTPVSGDASFRRYFRVRLSNKDDAKNAIVMDAPPEHEDVTPFVAIAKQLEGYEILAPRILAEEPTQGFLLISDLGNEMFFDRVVGNAGGAAVLYPMALKALADLQIASARVGGAESLPKYDRVLLSTECQLFDDWLVQKHLGGVLPADVAGNIEAIVEAVQQQPYGFVHRDYHSRNLMLVGDQLAMIDFQDAVDGPVTYDAVSLLKDAYIRWPAAELSQWLEGYYQQLHGADIVQCGWDEFQRWFDWMGLQRHIKVAGIFCRLNYRDGKPGYMADIPLVLEYIIEAAGRYPELKPLHDYVSTTVLPEFQHG